MDEQAKIAAKTALNERQNETVELPCIVRPNEFETWDGGSFWGITCFKHTLSIRLNRILCRFQPDVVFKAGDQIVFKLKKGDKALKAVKNALRIKS